jgi:hypothetical protein
MISTLFGDLNFDNQAGMQQWLAAHDTEHRLIRRTVAQSSAILLNASFLSTEPDDDWMGRHGLAHLGFERLYSARGTAPATTLLQGTWQNANDFYTWHQSHNLIHQTLRQQLGIYGSN